MLLLRGENKLLKWFKTLIWSDKHGLANHEEADIRFDVIVDERCSRIGLDITYERTTGI